MPLDRYIVRLRCPVCGHQYDEFTEPPYQRPWEGHGCCGRPMEAVWAGNDGPWRLALVDAAIEAMEGRKDAG